MCWVFLLLQCLGSREAVIRKVRYAGPMMLAAYSYPGQVPTPQETLAQEEEVGLSEPSEAVLVCCMVRACYALKCS